MSRGSCPAPSLATGQPPRPCFGRTARRTLDRHETVGTSPKLLSDEQEAQLIALRLGPPPGYGNWSQRLLARQVVELGIVDSISHETAGRTLIKTDSRVARCGTG